MADRIKKWWRAEVDKVWFLRHTMLCAPSRLADDDWPPERMPNRDYWARVRNNLIAKVPDVRPGQLDFVLRLEQRVWQVRRKAYWLSPGQVADRVESFWEQMLDRLTGGFPYYSFLSQFSFWREQYLQGRQESARREIQGVPIWILENELSKQVDQPGDESPSPVLEPEHLRWFREGYRLVRTTFFRRADRQELGHENVHEKLRRAADMIWYTRLERSMDEDGELEPETIDEIVRKCPGLNRQTINMVCNRLRSRMWAYSLARVLGVSDEEIRWMRIPERFRHGNAEEYPFVNNATALTVASLARTAIKEHTLLWVVTARLWLHSKIEPQRPDPCDYHRYVRELWRWVADETFDAALKRGADDGSRTDQAVLAALDSGPLGPLFLGLQTLESEQRLDAFVASRSIEQEKEERKAIRQVVRGLAGPRGLHTGCRQCLPQWRRGVGNRLVIPLWYLTVLQQVSRRALLAQLQTPADDRQGLVHVSEGMKQCRTCTPGDRQGGS